MAQNYLEKYTKGFISLIITIILALLAIAIFGPKLGYKETILAIILPLLMSVTAYLFNNDSLLTKVNFLKQEIEKYAVKNKLVIHGQKYYFPEGINRKDFWDQFLEEAEYKFILIGKTNKSWVGEHKDPKKTSREIFRILKNEGKVSILSDSKNKERNMIFFKNYLENKISSSDMSISTVNKNLRYVIRDNIKYDAIVSDDTLIINPRNNIVEQGGTAVLEINKLAQNDIYNNYLDDIKRILSVVNDVKIPWEDWKKERQHV